MKYTQDTRRL